MYQLAGKKFTNEIQLKLFSFTEAFRLFDKEPRRNLAISELSPLLTCFVSLGGDFFLQVVSWWCMLA